MRRSILSPNPITEFERLRKQAKDDDKKNAAARAAAQAVSVKKQ
jgi:hypothetical protein